MYLTGNSLSDQLHHQLHQNTIPDASPTPHIQENSPTQDVKSPTKGGTSITPPPPSHSHLEATRISLSILHSSLCSPHPPSLSLLWKHHDFSCFPGYSTKDNPPLSPILHQYPLTYKYFYKKEYIQIVTSLTFSLLHVLEIHITNTSHLLQALKLSRPYPETPE